jgi:hypothetical protein
MTPETWLEPSGLAASLYLGIVSTGLIVLAFRRRWSRSRHRKYSQLDEPSAQFRAVAGFLERYRDSGEPKQEQTTS